MKTKKQLFLILLSLSATAISCHNNSSSAKSAVATDTLTIPKAQLPKSENFKTIVRNDSVGLYFLKSKGNANIAITNYGGRLVSIIVPDKNSNPTDVILGHDDIKDYIKPKENYFGAIIGRYGNRIAKGKFNLDGKTYHLDINDGVNTLHGGLSGFYNRVFKAKQISDRQLELSYFSKDGEGGYPGNLWVKVVYILTDDNALKIEYSATTDKTTIINLTNHAYFNLSGAGSKTITDNLLKINANNITPIDTTFIPTGKLMPVNGTPFDFTAFKTIGADIGKTDEQLKNGKGYDHNFVLNKHAIGEPVATVKSTETGIAMDIYTEEPGLQFYSGNFLTGDTRDGKGGASYGYRAALCLETQHFPDSPNEPSFPSTVLKPGETYHTVTIYKFYTK